MEINIALFEGFEPLDVFGPFEVFAHVEGIHIHLFSLDGSRVVSGFGGVRVATAKPENIDCQGILLVPGGPGTRGLVKNLQLIGLLRDLAGQASQVLTVCTGSALLAATGLLNGRRATSNDLAFNWVAGVNDQVIWVRQARWVADGDIWTSSGISAGIDMTLSFLEDIVGTDAVDMVCTRMEYIRNRDPGFDPFAV